MSELRSEVAALGGAYAEIERRLVEVQSALAELELVQSAAPASPRFASALDPDETAPAPSPAQLDANRDERIADLEGRMSEPSRSSGWEARAADAIPVAFESQQLDGATLESVHCRGSICRIEVAAEDSEALDRLFVGEPLVEWPHRGHYFVEGEGGDLRSVMYLVRDER